MKWGRSYALGPTLFPGGRPGSCPEEDHSLLRGTLGVMGDEWRSGGVWLVPREGRSDPRLVGMGLATCALPPSGDGVSSALRGSVAVPGPYAHPMDR